MLNQINRIISIIFFTLTTIALWSLTTTKVEMVEFVITYFVIALYVAIMLFAKSRK